MRSRPGPFNERLFSGQGWGGGAVVDGVQGRVPAVPFVPTFELELVAGELVAGELVPGATVVPGA